MDVGCFFIGITLITPKVNVMSVKTFYLIHVWMCLGFAERLPGVNDYSASDANSGFQSSLYKGCSQVGPTSSQL